MRMIIKKGFTLVETVVFIMVISIGLSGVMALLLPLIRHSAEPIIVGQATSIAIGYMEEILGQAFYDPDTGEVCPAAPLERTQFDNVCDYKNYFNHASISDINGNTFPNLAGYTVSAAITSPAILATIPGTDVIQVTVTVHHSEIPDVVLIGYRTPY